MAENITMENCQCFLPSIDISVVLEIGIGVKQMTFADLGAICQGYNDRQSHQLIECNHQTPRLEQ